MSRAKSRTCSAGWWTPRRPICCWLEHGHENLRLVDNGVVNRRSPALVAELEHVRGYHLVPASASKAAAVALHARARGYVREETFAVGDSREDLACAAARGRVLAGRQCGGARPVDPRGDGGV